jgi:putative transposase
VKRSHIVIRDWIKKYNPKRLYYRKTKIFEFIVDETIIRVDSEYIWLWIAIENNNLEILKVSIFKERNMYVAERSIPNLVKRYREHPVSNRWR